MRSTGSSRSPASPRSCSRSTWRATSSPGTQGPRRCRTSPARSREGADAFVKRQYTTIAVLAVVGAVIIGAVIAFVEAPEVADVPSLAGVPIGVLTGLRLPRRRGLLDGLGHHRHDDRVRSNVRTASAARRSLVEAVQVAMRGGAVSRLPRRRPLAPRRVGHLHRLPAPARRPGRRSQEAPFVIVGFGFGASFVALFAQLGGGIYTKAADVGSDLVGKVEKGIPEDDPRNAGVIADLVGDNVGDCAGRGADLFESTAAENIGAMILGVAVYNIAISSAGRTPRPGSSSRSSSAPSGSWPPSSRCSSSAARRPRTR